MADRTIRTLSDLREAVKTTPRVYVSAGGLGYLRVSRAQVLRVLRERLRDGLLVDRTYAEDLAFVSDDGSVYLLGDW